MSADKRCGCLPIYPFISWWNTPYGRIIRGLVTQFFGAEGEFLSTTKYGVRLWLARHYIENCLSAASAGSCLFFFLLYSGILSMDRQGEFSSTIYSPWCVWSFFFFFASSVLQQQYRLLVFLVWSKNRRKRGLYIYPSYQGMQLSATYAVKSASIYSSAHNDTILLCGANCCNVCWLVADYRPCCLVLSQVLLLTVS